jgi:DNA repair protein RecN (Recombination protein N)
MLHEAESLSEEISEIKNIATSLNDAIAAIDDAVNEMRTLADRAEANPGEQEELILRQNDLRDLANKHGCDVSELAEKLEELKKTLDELLEFENEDSDLMPKIIEAGQEFYKSATTLRDLRNKGGKKLSREIKKHLSKLGMENADFEVKVIALEKMELDYKELAKIGSENGLDEICFAIRPNKGENWGSITETASGGETTRTMLAIKCAAAKVNPCELQIFDEIDAGVGGRLGEAIANQLEELSKHRQVITITHLPQIAAKGENHLCVKKVTNKNRTTTTVTKLDGEERVIEIAEMIRGSKSNETTLSQAREMIGNEK